MNRNPLLWLPVAALFALTACAQPTSITKTLDRKATGDFDKILVVGVAADYNGRAMFERAVVSRIRAAGGSATAYHTVLGKNPPLDRETVQKAIAAESFDAVLVTRVKDRQLDTTTKTGPAGGKANAIGGSVVNLFRYDYEELDEPDIIEFSASVTLTTEFYTAADGEPVWAVETTSRNKSNIGELADSSADAIVGQLRRDRLIGQ